MRAHDVSVFPIERTTPPIGNFIIVPPTEGANRIPRRFILVIALERR